MTEMNVTRSSINSMQIMRRLLIAFCIFQGESGVAADAFYDLVYRKKQILMVVGSADSEVTKSLGEVVPYWNLVLVSKILRTSS